MTVKPNALTRASRAASAFHVRNLWEKARYKKLIASIDRHEILILSGSMAYTTALALAPFIIIMLSILTLLSPNSQEAVVRELTGVLGAEAGNALESIIGNAENQTTFRGVSGLVSFLVLAVSASAIFSQMRIAFDKIMEFKPEADANSGIWRFIKDRLFSVGLVFGFIFLLITSLIVTTGIAAVFSGDEGFLWESVAMAGNLVVFTVLFASIFRFIPSERRGWRSCIRSGLVATLFFLGGKALISVYLAKSAVGSAYGAAGSLVVLLVWLYYTSLTLLLSFEFSNTVVVSAAPRAKF